MKIVEYAQSDKRIITIRFTSEDPAWQLMIELRLAVETAFELPCSLTITSETDASLTIGDERDRPHADPEESPLVYVSWIKGYMDRAWK